MGEIAHWRAAASMLERANNKAANSGGTHAARDGSAAARCRVSPPRRNRPGRQMDFPIELLINAIIAGVLLGGFYVAVTVGISISFGMLDIVNIAHPAFIILGSYLAYIINQSFGLDPDAGRPPDAAGVLCARRRDLSGLLPVVREARAGSAARPRVLLRHPVHHRGRADPRVRRRLPLRRRRLYRADAAVRLRRPALPHAGSLRALARDVRGAAALSVAHLHRARHHGGGAGSAGAQPDGGEPDQDQAHRVRHLDRDRRDGRARS